MSTLRVRTRGGFSSSAQMRWAWWTTPNSPVWSTAFKADASGETASMTDIVTPGFKRLVNSGQIVNNRMSSTMTRLSTTTSGPACQNSVSVPNQVQHGQHDGPHWTAGGPLKDLSVLATRPTPPDDLANLRALAATRALANIDQPDFEGFVSLGEMRETLRYLRNPVAAGLQLASTLARKSRVSGLTIGATRKERKNPVKGSVASDLASIHLSVIYGFKPLVKEVAGALENLRPRAVPRPVRRTARAREEKTHTDTWSVTEKVGGYAYTATYTYTRKRIVRCGYLYETGVVPVEENTWGMRPKDIIPAAYAVAPLSFVLDYFVNMGTFISALVPSAGTRTLTSWITIRTEHKLTRTVGSYTVDSAVPGWTVTRQGSGSDTVEIVTYERQPWADAPSLAFKDLDTIKNDVSKLSGMLSLLTSRLLSSKQHLDAVTNRRTTGRKLAVGDWSNW